MILLVSFKDINSLKKNLEYQIDPKILLDNIIENLNNEEDIRLV